ncbi:RDD family protein [Actinomadura graeca]|uniref:RDD family protein n=1 Tax=Actinomadura graeca TaxID=2750812 RepID=A0ABX8QXD6_9ACTN|nr:RDD family protein [Actinomadura graeca]QXJ23504.1 RDD family protein [Actinomadura graeca]
MSDSHDRGRPYQPPQGQGSYGPPPPYQNPPQRQQPQEQRQQARQQQWQQQPQQQQWQQDQWQQQSYEQQSYQRHEPSYDEYGDSGNAADLPLAPIHRRAGARIIDNALVAVFGFALVLPVTVGAFGLGKAGSKAEDEGGIWNWPIIFTLFFVLSVLPFIYEAVQLSMWGRTLGKRVLGLGVVQVRPAGAAVTTTQAVWRAAVTHVAYQIGVFFFLVLAVMVWSYAAYGMLLVWAGGLMAYLWAIWDQPLHQALHDRFSGTIVIDERVDDSEYNEYAE